MFVAECKCGDRMMFQSQEDAEEYGKAELEGMKGFADLSKHEYSVYEDKSLDRDMIVD